MLKLEKVSVAYKLVTVLSEICLEVNKGEIVALIGPNNAGKSTLLRTVSGLLKPKHGKITLSGQDLLKLRPDEIVELGVVLVPEGRQLFREMNVEENLKLGSYCNRARPKREANLQWVYSLFPALNKRQNIRADKLSGGEAQMLALGRALMSIPDLLLLDEPSLGLAPIPARMIFNVFTELNHTGLTILLVEQNVNLSMKISHRGYVLHNCIIALSGDSGDLMNNSELKRIYLGKN